jgi:hypothetical protein
MNCNNSFANLTVKLKILRKQKFDVEKKEIIEK